MKTTTIEKLAEQTFHLEVLGLWAIAKTTGYAPDDIHAFTFSDQFLVQSNPEMTKANNRARASQLRHPYSGLTHHNAVRMKDNTLKEIPLTPRPEPPPHMKCQVQEKL